ncbi:MAG TPA: tetratricopeptide repeat protein [Bacteroidia bacterium]|nr:tetratricopeptide repeat protein [Bacteroidia bacterium]
MANELMNERKWESALQFLSGCIARNGQFGEYHFLRGKCYAMLDAEEVAIISYSHAIEFAPDSAKYYFERAASFYIILEFSKSKSDYEQALSLYKTASDSASIIAHLGMTNLHLGDTALAIQQFHRAINLDSASAEAYVHYSILLVATGEFERALKYLNTALNLDSTSIFVWSNLGYTNTCIGDYQKAMSYFEKCILIDPDHPFNYSNRGYCKLMLGDTLGALRDVEHSLRKYARNSYAWRNLGMIYLAQGDPINACAAFSASLERGFTKLYGNEVLQLQQKHCRQ